MLIRAWSGHEIQHTVLVTGTSTLVVSLDEVKAHLRLDSTDTSEDTWLTMAILAATDSVEKFLKRDLITKTYSTYLQSFVYEAIELRRAPLGSITSISYYDVNNALQTLPGTAYTTHVTNGFSMVTTAPEQAWPDTYDRPQAVQILFTAGYGASGSSVPAPIRMALLNLVASVYSNRGDCDTGTCDCSGMIAGNVKSMLQPYRIAELNVNSPSQRLF